jgi:hypothetical protein
VPPSGTSAVPEPPRTTTIIRKTIMLLIRSPFSAALPLAAAAVLLAASPLNALEPSTAVSSEISQWGFLQAAVPF